MSSETTNSNEPRFTDKIIQCKICGEEFIWTAGEQRFYADRGLNEPKRCSICRQRRTSYQGGGQ